MSNPYEPPHSDLGGVSPGGKGGEVTPAAVPLAWYDQAWIALPFVLVVVGGAIGGACGGAAWAVNRKVFGAIANPALRYAATGLISLASVVAYLALAFAFVRLVRGGG